MLSVRVPAEIHLAQGFLVSYAEAREITTSKATQNACNAKEPENQAMGCLVRVARAKGLVN